ncbi:hypothetical protein BM735_01130 [Erysipelotrichaceae bacterium NYU-BL-F16]|nr:hypothetical protein BM735_01130 [Erysipelotrichaceae bacterium NYU-BL-F16]
MVIRHNEKSSSFVVDNLPTVTGGFNPVKYKELTMNRDSGMKTWQVFDYRKKPFRNSLFYVLNGLFVYKFGL